MAEPDAKPDDDGANENVRQYAAELFAVGTTVKRIAELAEVSERTVYRWLAEPQCKEAVERIRAGSLSAVSGLLGKHLRSSMARLIQMTQDKQDRRLQLVAIKLHADLALKVRVIEEIGDRLKLVEERLGMGQGGVKA